MKIFIINDFTITIPDDVCFYVSKKCCTRLKAKKSGKTNFRPISYHGSLEDALTSLIRRVGNGNMADNLERHLEAIRTVRADIRRTVEGERGKGRELCPIDLGKFTITRLDDTSWAFCKVRLYGRQSAKSGQPRLVPHFSYGSAQDAVQDAIHLLADDKVAATLTEHIDNIRAIWADVKKVLQAVPGRATNEQATIGL